jgi:hypothetical protein
MARKGDGGAMAQGRKNVDVGSLVSGETFRVMVYFRRDYRSLTRVASLSEERLAITVAKADVMRLVRASALEIRGSNQRVESIRPLRRRTVACAAGKRK